MLTASLATVRVLRVNHCSAATKKDDAASCIKTQNGGAKLSHML